MADRFHSTNPFAECDHEADNLENMAALLSGWWDGTIEGRGFSADGTCRLTIAEYNLIAFAVRDLADRSKKVGYLVSGLPR